MISKYQDSINIPWYYCFRAPAGCVQYFTGASGNVQSYNFQGGVMLTGQNYNNCFRQELGTYTILCQHQSFIDCFFKGFCTINYNQNSGTSPDPFDLYGTIATNANGGAEVSRLLVFFLREKSSCN